METIQVQVSSELAQQLQPHSQHLPQILEWGLRVLEQQQSEHNKVAQTLLSTGFIGHLSPETSPDDRPRQPPPELSGPPVSEILLAQRRGKE